jgi:hypothetical protein
MENFTLEQALSGKCPKCAAVLTYSLTWTIANDGDQRKCIGVSASADCRRCDLRANAPLAEAAITLSGQLRELLISISGLLYSVSVTAIQKEKRRTSVGL